MCLLKTVAWMTLEDFLKKSTLICYENHSHLTKGGDITAQYRRYHKKPLKPPL